MIFIRMHKVDAKPMTRGEYNKKRGWELPANENPNDEGYIVSYPDGYVSWCPKKQFEDAAFSADGKIGCPDEELLECALRTFHDAHYSKNRVDGSLCDMLVKAYYHSFVPSDSEQVK